MGQDNETSFLGGPLCEAGSAQEDHPREKQNGSQI